MAPLNIKLDDNGTIYLWTLEIPPDSRDLVAFYDQELYAIAEEVYGPPNAIPQQRRLRLTRATEGRTEIITARALGSIVEGETLQLAWTNFSAGSSAPPSSVSQGPLASTSKRKLEEVSPTPAPASHKRKQARVLVLSDSEEECPPSKIVKQETGSGIEKEGLGSAKSSPLSELSAESQAKVQMEGPGRFSTNNLATHWTTDEQRRKQIPTIQWCGAFDPARAYTFYPNDTILRLKQHLIDVERSSTSNVWRHIKHTSDVWVFLKGGELISDGDELKSFTGKTLIAENRRLIPSTGSILTTAVVFVTNLESFTLAIKTMPKIGRCRTRVIFIFDQLQQKNAAITPAEYDLFLGNHSSSYESLQLDTFLDTVNFPPDKRIKVLRKNK